MAQILGSYLDIKRQIILFATILVITKYITLAYTDTN